MYVVGSRDLGLLFKYRHEKEFHAEDGGAGKKDSLHGANGEDLILKFPLGSILTNLTTGKVVHVLSEEKPVLLLKGGDGGFGNEHYKSSIVQAPTRTTPGYPCEEADYHIELQLLVDVGFAGFPNAGKSSLLNVLTNADAKVGAYEFTTLEPNLGAFHGYILADIPGLIEGASEGKGLGHKFLRHINRTKMIAHLISLENEDVMASYKTIRKELESHSEERTKKDEIIILTKTDIVDEATVKEAIKKLSKLKRPIFTMSIYDDASIKVFADAFVKMLRDKEKEQEK
ncbi:MAG: GTPase obg [Parcubacteria group bacterium GW2011_GWA2_47_7]|nr:MAG: GTPase obg [Parcubacteria group bacterium GW2011_GWA2_47_7]